MSGTLRGLYEQLLTSMRPTPDPAPRASASVVPWRRDGAGQLEVYWMRRAPTLAFMGGWWAFTGGGVAKSDAAVPFVGRPAGLSATSFTDPLPELAEKERAELGLDLIPGLLAAAARELFEEIGVLLTPAAALTPARIEALRARRRELLARQVDFATLLEREGLTLDVSPLVSAGRWLTPPLGAMRFDNRFFLLEWSTAQPLQPVLEGEEHDRGEWIAPAAALARWQSGEVIAAPPTLHLLRVLAEAGPEDGLGRLRDPAEANLGPLRRIEFRPGVVLLPMRTRTLLPATRTNGYLLGTREVVLIDPAPTDRREIERLRRAVAAAQEQGRQVTAIWLTHHHRDHVGAVGKLRRELGVPVYAHALAAEPLARLGIELDGTLEDDQRVVLGGDPPFPVRVLHTPGHAPGHLAFLDETHGSLLVGDLAAGVGTIVIDPPEGDMDAYLGSLERMIDLAPQTVFPAHGPPQVPGADKLRELREHRLDREQKVLAAWRAGKKTPGEMVAEVYDDAPREVHPIAERQIAAHLLRLEKLGLLEE